MFIIIGILVVLGAILGGYLMEHGKIAVLIQPAELVIILGAGIGSLVIANPLHNLKALVATLMAAMKPSKYTKGYYLENLKMMFELLNKARKGGGLLAIEADIEQPDQSEIFNKNAAFMKDHHTRDFLCDTLRMAITGGVDPFDLDQLMEVDMDTAHHEAMQPVSALTTMADALPGLGIVAAVLGVVITMGALGGPPEEIGHKVAAALVGTFLGVLMCYGFVGPLASNMAKMADEEHAYHQSVKVLLLAFIKGTAPVQAIEFGRRAIPMRLRPSFQEVEEACKALKNTGATAAVAAEGEAATGGE